MTKIKNPILAKLLTKVGVEVTAELVIDDSNGVTLTFPDISDIAEIVEGVAVDAVDGTYVIANGEESLTVVVLAGVVTSVTSEAPAPVATTDPLDAAEVLQVLEAVTDEVVAVKQAFASVTAELKTLKASLKHDTEELGAAAASTDAKDKYKIVD